MGVQFAAIIFFWKFLRFEAGNANAARWIRMKFELYTASECLLLLPWKDVPRSYFESAIRCSSNIISSPVDKTSPNQLPSGEHQVKVMGYLNIQFFRRDSSADVFAFTRATGHQVGPNRTTVHQAAFQGRVQKCGRIWGSFSSWLGRPAIDRNRSWIILHCHWPTLLWSVLKCHFLVEAP